jgi:hypothetical protein
MGVQKKIQKKKKERKVEKKLVVDGEETTMVIARIGDGQRAVWFERNGKAILIPESISCTMIAKRRFPFSHPAFKDESAKIPHYYKVGSPFEFYFFNGEEEICSIVTRSGMRIRFHDDDDKK